MRIGIFRKSEDIYLIILGIETGEALGVQLWPIFDVEVNTFNLYFRLSGGDIRIIHLFKDKHISVSAESDFLGMLAKLTQNRPNLQLKDGESYFNENSHLIKYSKHDLFKHEFITQNQKIKLDFPKHRPKEIQWNILLERINHNKCIMLEYSTESSGIFRRNSIYIKLGFDHNGKFDQYSHIILGKILFGILYSDKRINFQNFL